jgi:peptidyl-prolyl cis-trans isomerase D
MSSKKSGGIGKMVIWALMGLLILGLGGFGITGLSGTIRSVGSVGTQDISVDDYARALQEDIRAIEAQTKQPFSFAQAREFGVDRAALGRLVGQAALDHETDAAGLSIGDENLARELTAISAFKGIDGKFDREAYRFTLDQNGWSEAEFETRVRADAARSLMQAAIASGIEMPKGYTDAVVNYAAARRAFEYTRLTPDNLPEVLPEATEADLTAYFDAHQDLFKAPAMRRFTYVWLTPDMILDQVEVDEAALRALYDDRKDEFMKPERRLVERLAFATAGEAEAEKVRIETNETTFDEVVTARGLTLDDVDLGDIDRPALGAAADAVFNADAGQVVGPFDTAIGPALFRMNGVLSEETVTFEEALPDLRAELAMDRARRQIEGDIQTIDDMLAGGATLEEIAAETDLKLATIDWHEDQSEAIAGYPAFNDAARDAEAGDYPKVVVLDDGGIFALRLEEEIAERPYALDEVKERVQALWEADRTETALRTYAETLVPRLLEGATFEMMGLTTNVEPGATRAASMLGTPPDFMTRVFAMTPNEVSVVTAFGAAWIVRMNAALPPDEANPQVAALRATVSGQASGGLQQDIYGAFAVDIQRRAGVSLDQAAINAVHANFQ